MVAVAVGEDDPLHLLRRAAGPLEVGQHFRRLVGQPCVDQRNFATVVQDVDVRRARLVDVLNAGNNLHRCVLLSIVAPFVGR